VEKRRRRIRCASRRPPECRPEVVENADASFHVRDASVLQALGAKEFIVATGVRDLYRVGI
jgi:quinolinate synthase